MTPLVLKCGQGEWDCVVGMGLKFCLEAHGTEIYHLSAQEPWNYRRAFREFPDPLGFAGSSVPTARFWNQRCGYPQTCFRAL